MLWYFSTRYKAKAFKHLMLLEISLMLVIFRKITAMKRYLILACVLPLFCLAQVPNLLKDINPGIGGCTFGQFTLLPNNNILFFVNTPTPNVGLWTSDGSTAGTKLLKGIAGSQFTDYAGKKFFATGHHGYPLWKTDGTLAGTDSIPIPGLTAIASMTVWNNLLIFAGTHTASGTELWRSDGTAAGTYILKDAWAGVASSILLFPLPYWVSSNGYFYFAANDGIHGNEFWRTDGTSAGTILLKDIHPGSASAIPSFFKPWAGNNGVYFAADDGVNGYQTWFTDGTTANTILLLNHGPGSSALPEFSPLFLGNTAYFTVNSRALFKTDGTVANTSSVALLPTFGNTLTPLLMRPGLQEYNGDIYYLLYNNISLPGPQNPYEDTICFYRISPSLSSRTLLNKVGYDPWPYSQPISSAFPYKIGPRFMYILDGGNYAHLFVYNVAQNTLHTFLSSHNNILYTGLPDNIQLFGNKFYLPAYGNSIGFEPSYYDLATDTLLRVKPGSNIRIFCSYNPTGYIKPEILQLNGKNYFLGYSSATGTELYETDFTPAGTFLLKDIYPGANSFFGSSPTIIHCNEGKLVGIVTPNNIFFAADDGSTGFELWSFINSPNPTALSQNTIDKAEIKIYPNPAKGKFSIQSSSTVLKVEIMSLDGKLIQVKSSKELETNNEISTPGNAGIYFVRVHTANKVYTQKLLVAP